jgi:hypothetical protein
MVIIMTMTIEEFINDFSRTHTIQSLDSDMCGIVITSLNSTDFLIRLGDVNYAGND